jgi:hypothetical protein
MIFLVPQGDGSVGCCCEAIGKLSGTQNSGSVLLNSTLCNLNTVNNTAQYTSLMPMFSLRWSNQYSFLLNFKHRRQAMKRPDNFSYTGYIE